MKAEIVDAYMQQVQAVFATGETTEHSFRPALEFLFKNITDDVSVINEPNSSQMLAVLISPLSVRLAKAFLSHKKAR